MHSETILLLRPRIVEFVPNCVLGLLLVILLVECDDVDDFLGILFLFLLGNASVRKYALPFFGETLDIVSKPFPLRRGVWRTMRNMKKKVMRYREFASVVIVADVRDVNRILWRRYVGSSW